MRDKISLIFQYIHLILIYMGEIKNTRTESLSESSSLANINNKGIFDYSPKQILKLLDDINIKIVSELVKEPNMSSISLANKLDIPLSTIQRRRATLEKSIIKKKYYFNYKAFGGRVGDLIINVDRGRSKEVSKLLLERYKCNVTFCHTRIDSAHNVLVRVVYKDTEELHKLIESVKSMEFVTDVQWSEVVEIIGDNDSDVIANFFNKSK